MAEERDTSALSPSQWSRDLAALASGPPLDVLVVGGGVVGAGAALDAASRGLRTGLLEAQDWGSGSSSRSSKLAHGGLRYLRMLDVGLVREALAERTRLLANAPHLVRPARFLYPIRHRLWERPYVRLGVGTYDLLARRSESDLGGHEVLSRRETLALAPCLRPRPLVGGITYGDAQVDDARLVVALVRTAVARGALAVSRAEVVGGLDAADGTRRLGGVRVRLAETGEGLEVRARVVVLAGGAWNDELERRLGVAAPVQLAPSKGVHLVVHGSAIRSSAALIVPTRHSVLFVLPWGAHWLVGTTDTPWAFDRGHPVASRPDIDYLLDQASAVLARPLVDDDLLAVYAGIRPLLAGAGGGTPQLSREHAVSRPAAGLVSVSGGKLTTYRVMAAQAIDAALEVAGLPAAPCRTASLALVGAAGASDAAPGLAGPVEGAPRLLRRQVVHAVSHEGARHLEDVLARRTRVAFETVDRGVHAANEVAALMAAPLGWDAGAVRREVEAYRRAVRAELAAEAAASDAGAVRVLGASVDALPVP